MIQKRNGDAGVTVHDATMCVKWALISASVLLCLESNIFNKKSDRPVETFDRKQFLGRLWKYIYDFVFFLEDLQQEKSFQHSRDSETTNILTFLEPYSCKACEQFSQRN